MTLPVSPNAIKFSQINAELHRGNTSQINIGNSILRSLAEKPNGQISLSDLYGKSYSFSLPSTANVANIDLRAAALAAGWNGISELVFENTGIIYSTSTTVPAVIITGSFPNGVTFNNSGLVVGKGGRGGDGGGSQGGNGTAGGAAIFANTNVTINNTGTIAGGGGGGGGGGMNDSTPLTRYGGGGGGGGAGLGAGGASAPRVLIGDVYQQAPGADGTFYAGGAGAVTSGGDGGAGGAWGQAGTVGETYSYRRFLTSYVYNYGGTGGAAGAAILGNSYITWTATGTRYGTIS